MRPIRATIPLEEARRIVLEAVQPIERTETVPLADAHRRVLARDLVATIDVPPFSRAGMDGYAVRAEDTFDASRGTPRELTVVETLYTGQVARTSLGPGMCSEIATGAPMPEGADAVVMVEETAREEGSTCVRVFSPVHPRQHVGRQGADITDGQTVLHAGTVLTPSRIGAAAAIGVEALQTWAQPLVAIAPTGNEIVEAGAPLGPGAIYDINTHTLTGIVRAHGGVPLVQAPVPDTLTDLTHALDRCLAADLIVLSGGSSVGDRDHVLDALAARGEVRFHGIAAKPGKPTAFALVDGKPVFGLPGYPTSCLANGYLLLLPALRQMARLPEYQPQTRSLPLSARIVSTTGRHQFYTVRIANGRAVPAFKASGDITSMSAADGYIEIPTHVDIVEEGEVVQVTLF